MCIRRIRHGPPQPHLNECRKDAGSHGRSGGGSMAFRPGRFLLWTIAVLAPAMCSGEDARQFVQRAVQTELAKDRNDHTRWIYFEDDRKEEHSVKQWVAETREGT